MPILYRNSYLSPTSLKAMVLFVRITKRRYSVLFIFIHNLLRCRPTIILGERWLWCLAINYISKVLQCTMRILLKRCGSVQCKFGEFDVQTDFQAYFFCNFRNGKTISINMFTDSMVLIVHMAKVFYWF